MARRRARTKTDPATHPPEVRTFRTQKQTGRPPLPPGEALDATFTVRLKKAEKARFEALAAAAGLSLTAWARRTLLAAANRQEGRPGGSKGGGKPGGGAKQ